MRAAPLKGDCKVCQYPEALRLAVNGAIWTEDGTRFATYIARAQAILAGFPEHKIDRKTVMRHVDHVENTWRDVLSGEVVRPDEVPVVSYGDAAATARFLGLRVLERAGELVNHPNAHAILPPKDLVSIGNLAHKYAALEEQLRVKQRGQDADLIKAIFAASAGHIAAAGDESADVDELRVTVAEERRLLTEHAGR